MEQYFSKEQSVIQFWTYNGDYVPFIFQLYDGLEYVFILK